MDNMFDHNTNSNSSQDDIANYKREIEHLNQVINNLNLKIQKSESFKTHFISNITNELINPFTSILGLSKIILSVKKEEWKKVITMVALIHSEAFIIEFQLRNIFTAAKIEAGLEVPQPVKLDVKEFMANIEETFKMEARKRNLTIGYQCKPIQNRPYFVTDSGKLKIIIANIVHNAIKFSHDGGSIEVNFQVANNQLTIIVKDEGIGIPKEKHSMIFDRFERLNTNINSINRGQGLGLSVSLSLLDMLGGNISLSSVEEKGSIFTIEIPEMQEQPDDIAVTDSEIYFNDGEIF